MTFRNAVCGLWMMALVSPPEPGLEAGGSLGGGRYRVVSGCAHPQPPTYYAETSVSGHARYRLDNGVTFAAEGSYSEGKVREGPLGPREGFDVAGRVGWHARYGGIEAGAAAHRHRDSITNDRRTDLLPSVLGWAGVEPLHVFGRLIADRYAVDQGDLTFGLGHSSRWFGVEAGVGIQGFVLDAEVRPTRWLAPGVSLRYQSDSNWNLAGTLTFRWDPGGR